MKLLRHTRRLHHVFLLAVAVAADVVEGEKEVMLFMQLSRQLQLDLRRNHRRRKGRCGRFDWQSGMWGDSQENSDTAPKIVCLANWPEEKVGGVIARSSVYALFG